MFQSENSDSLRNTNGGHPDKTMSVPLLHKAKSNDETPILNPRPTIHQLALSIIEACSILNLVFPMVLTGLLLYTRSMISMFFLGRLGSLPRRRLLAIGFANITGYPFSPGLPPAWSPSVVRPTAPAVQIISVSPSAAQFYSSSLLLSPSPYSGSTCAVFSFSATKTQPSPKLPNRSFCSPFLTSSSNPSYILYASTSVRNPSSYHSAPPQRPLRPSISPINYFLVSYPA
ncbi:hypothetical protein HPP92_021831 [Vanilla planifolia]|uniref:Uncharacterized protein n=1 Tax=Vanilla planifolia TaxID=51239 RepID=A0A835PX18_VANPL|nr:hypothetical protein HPP92_021831 [Vanilla planifolia]